MKWISISEGNFIFLFVILGALFWLQFFLCEIVFLAGSAGGGPPECFVILLALFQLFGHCFLSF